MTSLDWNSLKYMQDMNSGACAEAGIQETKQLIDKRDNNSYWITRLKDGNCWMTENLRLINIGINSNDSDITSGSFTVPASNISGFTASDQNTAKAYYNTSYGGYYNWYTATAGTGNTSITNCNAPSSICPKGWQLPTSNNTNSKSFGTLTSGISVGSALVASPYNFVYGGLVDNSSLSSAGSQGYYWSSTANSSTQAYNLNFTSSSVYPSYDRNRYVGLSVRCVAR